jgi:hypothetical protein
VNAPGAGLALRDYALAELERARDFLSWRHSRRHEGVHQGRKSLRRVRATLALAGGAFGPAGAWIDGELQRLNRSMSELRDGQALVEALAMLAKRHARDGHDKRALHDAHTRMLARARRAAERRRALLARSADAGADEPPQVLAVLQPALLALPWAKLDAMRVLQAFELSEERARAAGRRAIEGDREIDWHCWRRRERRLSQQCRALASVPLECGEAFHKSMADRLGEAQDFSLLLDHCGPESPFEAEDRRELREMAQRRLQVLRERLRQERLENLI